MAGKRRPSMGVRARLLRVLGWPTAQLRRIADEVGGRLEATEDAARAKYAKARAEDEGFFLTTVT